MEIEYDQSVDSVRIILRKNVEIEDSEPSATNPNIIIDFDNQNQPVAIEILHLKKLTGGIDDYLKELNFKIAN